MHAVLDVQSLCAQGGGHHRDSVCEGLEDLHPGPAAVAERHHGHRGPSQLILHGGDLAHHGHHAGLMQLCDIRAGTADQSHLCRRDCRPDAAGRWPSPATAPRRCWAGSRELPGRARRAARRRPGLPAGCRWPRVGVGDHRDVGQPGPGRIQVAGDHHPLHLCRHRPLESAPVAAVEPDLVPGQPAPYGGSSAGRSQLVRQQSRPAAGT